jgi:hypothetical protein
MPDYDCEVDTQQSPHTPSRKVLRTLGVHQGAEHTADAQHHGLRRTIQHALALLKDSPLACSMTIDERAIAAKICAFMNDHTPDARKHARIGKDWKVASNQALRGEAVFDSGESGQYARLLLDEMETHLADDQEFQDLDVDAQKRVSLLAYETIIRRLGDKAFSELSEEEQKNVDFAPGIHCGMHKHELWVCHGATGMARVYDEKDLPASIALPNAFQVAAPRAPVSNGQKTVSNTKKRTQSHPTRGAIKLTTLCGALFNNPNEKKGEKDRWKDWMEGAFGHRVALPDTGNTRFGSHCDCATSLVTRRLHFLCYLEEARDLKDSGEFVNIELNIYRALQDGPTLTELAVLALFSQAVSHPFMQHVRSPGLNALDQGPLYVRVQEHLKRLIAHPELLIGDRATPIEGTLFGRGWNLSEVIVCIQGMQQSGKLPHLEAVLVTFLQSALDSVPGTIPKFVEGGEVEVSTPRKRKRAALLHALDADDAARERRTHVAPPLCCEVHDPKGTHLGASQAAIRGG